MKRFINIIIILIAAFLFVLQVSFLSEKAFIKKTPKNEVETGVIFEPGVIYRQKIISTNGRLNELSVYIAICERINEGLLTVSFEKNNEEVKTWTINTEEIKDDQYIDFVFDRPIEITEADQLAVQLIDECENKDNSVALYLKKSDENGLYAGEEEIQGLTGCYQLTFNDISLRKRFLISLAIILALIVGAASFLIDFSTIKPVITGVSSLTVSFAGSVLFSDLINRTDRSVSNCGFWLELFCLLALAMMIVLLLSCFSRGRLIVYRVFLILVIPLSLIYLFMFQPANVPDGNYHYEEAYRYSNLLMGKSDEEEWTARAEDVEVIRLTEQANPGINDYKSIWQEMRLTAENEETVELPSAEHMNFYSPVNYLPQIVGLTIGRILHLSGPLTIYLAKILMLAVYILVCYYSIRITPVGKYVFAFVPLLPMCLMMSGSFSYDSMVIISALAISSGFLRLKQDITDNKILVWTTIWCFIGGAVKGGGNAILLLLVFICLTKENRKQIGRMMIPVTMGIVSVVLFDLVLAPVGLFQIGKEGNGYLTASFAFLNPIEFFRMLIRRWHSNLDRLTMNIGGSCLAWMEDVIPYACIVILLVLIALLSMYEKDETRIGKKEKSVFLWTIGLFNLLTPIMLLSATSVDANFIQGIQARYYLPVLPMLYLLITKYNLKQEWLANGKQSAVMRKGIIWFAGVSGLCVFYMLYLYCSRS